MRRWSATAELVVRNRVRMGTRRLRLNISQVLQLTVAATFAYGFCVYVLGHTAPFFAAVAAVVGIGPMLDRRLRRSMEIGFGAVLGVLFGDLFVHVFGSGLWQLAVMLFSAVCLGMFMNSGAIFVTQLGVQSIYIVTVPAALTEGTFTRTIDAVVGASTAVLLAFITPSDARKRPRNQAANLLEEITILLREASDALRREDPQAARRALSRARDSQQYVDSWRAALRIAEEAARINARSRRYVAEVTRLARACEFADRSMRMIRVVLRRAVSVSENGASDPLLADVAEGMADAAWVLRAALREGRDRAEAEQRLTTIAGTLRPTPAMQEDIEQTTMLLLLRPLVVDLIQAAGASAAEANAALPNLEVEPETGTLRVVDRGEGDRDREADASGATVRDEVGLETSDVAEVPAGVTGRGTASADGSGSGTARRDEPGARAPGPGGTGSGGAGTDTAPRGTAAADPGPEAASLPVIADPSAGVGRADEVGPDVGRADQVGSAEGGADQPTRDESGSEPGDETDGRRDD
ncbi:hypothetical protein GCM10023159_28200 [Brevibacterium yomogidense]